VLEVLENVLSAVLSFIVLVLMACTFGSLLLAVWVVRTVREFSYERKQKRLEKIAGQSVTYVGYVGEGSPVIGPIGFVELNPLDGVCRRDNVRLVLLDDGSVLTEVYDKASNTTYSETIHPDFPEAEICGEGELLFRFILFSDKENGKAWQKRLLHQRRRKQEKRRAKMLIRW